MNEQFLTMSVNQYIETINLEYPAFAWEIDKAAAERVQTLCPVIFRLLDAVYSENYQIEHLFGTQGIAIGVVCTDAVLEPGNDAVHLNSGLQDFLAALKISDRFSVERGEEPDTVCLVFVIDHLWKTKEQSNG